MVHRKHPCYDPHVLIHKDLKLYAGVFQQGHFYWVCNLIAQLIMLLFKQPPELIWSQKPGASIQVHEVLQSLPTGDQDASHCPLPSQPQQQRAESEEEQQDSNWHLYCLPVPWAAILCAIPYLWPLLFGFVCF